MRVLPFPFWARFSVFGKRVGSGRARRYQRHLAQRAAQSVGASDGSRHNPPFSIFPPPRLFSRKMETIPRTQSAAGSATPGERLHIFSIFENFELSRPLHAKVPMAWQTRGSASGKSLCMYSNYFKILGKKKYVGSRLGERERSHIVRVLPFPFWARFSVFGKCVGVGHARRYQRHLAQRAAQSVGASDGSRHNPPIFRSLRPAQLHRKHRTHPIACRATAILGLTRRCHRC